MVVEDDSTGTRLPIRLHSDILVSARRTRDGVLMRYEKPTTCAQIGIGVGVTLSKFLWIALLIFLLFFIVTAAADRCGHREQYFGTPSCLCSTGSSNFVKSL